MYRFRSPMPGRPLIRTALAVGISALVLAGCGGGSDGGPGGSSGPAPGANFEDPGGVQGEGGTFGEAGGLELGPVTATADPGRAVVTIDGGPTLEFTAAQYSGTFRCILGEDELSVSISASEGPGLSLTAADVGMGLNANLTVDSDEDPDRWIQYGGPLTGTLGLDVESGEVSYEGPVSRQDRNAMSDGEFDPETVNATVAINCGLEHSTAEFDGEVLTFAPLETSSGFSCLTTDREDIDVDLWYQTPEERRLNIDVRAESGGILGHANVESDGYKWSSTISTSSGSDAGLSIDDGTLTYTGTFTRTSDADGSETEVDGTVTVHCPNDPPPPNP